MERADESLNELSPRHALRLMTGFVLRLAICVGRVHLKIYPLSENHTILRDSSYLCQTLETRLTVLSARGLRDSPPEVAC
ncbi:hypothetical protein SAMN05444167_0729 [Terriglobus roseus]|uniref:Uncharacterized protein n=1 Tax=Terriglobus roseus TaxID=392734 RepID=A0A1G7GKV1_9BACT|nr:hypothetical protein SAMN05444167_0729 [Terriglobus roseus]